VNFTLDSRKTASESQILLEFKSKPVVLRASYRDINLISTIINKASSLSKPSHTIDDARQEHAKASQSEREQAFAKHGSERKILSDQPKALISREKVRHINAFNIFFY
jgi:vacuolar protein sorting-associated protein 13A/C